MPTKRRNHTRRRRVIDRTPSDDELKDRARRIAPNVTLPGPVNDTRPRRLTAAECLLADRIAHGEIDPVPHSSTPELTSFDDQPDYTAWLTSPDEPWPVTPGYNLHPNDSENYDASLHQGHIDESISSPLQKCVPNLASYDNARSHVSPSIRTSPEDEDSSDHDSVLYEEEDGTDLTRSEERHEVVETTASGRPRRACAPRSFVGLMKESTFTIGGFVNSEKSQADLIERAMVAHRELWKNRMVRGFSYSCGRIDDGNARSVLIEIAQSFGASVMVKKRQEPGKKGKKGKHVVMKPSARIRSPSDTNIQESANRIMSRRLSSRYSHNMPQPVNDAVTIQTKTRVPEKKHCKKEGGNAKVETAAKPRQLAESREKLRKDERAFESEGDVNGELLCADLIQRAIIAQRELWENRLVDGFSHNCGGIDDGIARGALLEIAVSFGALVRVEKRKESGKGKKTKHVVVRCGRRLRSPSEMNVQEKGESILKRRQVLSHYVSCDSKYPLASTADGIVKGERQPCTTQATDQHNNATKRELSLREDTGRAGTKNSREVIFQQKRQRKLEGTKLEITNKGFSMLTKMGWTEGGRLGAQENGISEPIVAQFRVGRSGLGKK